MKTNALLVTLLCLFSVCQQAQAQDEPAAYEVLANQANFWNPHADKPASIFVNMAYIRQEPSSRSQLIDSLAIGTPITFLNDEAINPTLIRGMLLPWQRIRYHKNNHAKEGYIWIGSVSLDQQRDEQSGLTFMHGFAWASVQDENNYYWVEAKVLDKQNQLLHSKGFAYFPSDQSYTTMELHNNRGLQHSKNILEIFFSGEACGISTETFNLSWNGSQLYELPKTMGVSDAGIFYYGEELKYSKQKVEGKQLIFKDIIQGEVIDETAEEPKYKETKKQERYTWDGQKYQQL